MRQYYAYSRNPVTLYRYLRRTGFYDDKPKRKPYKPKPYDTPEHIGVKWQFDVKHVPKECIADSILNDEKFYQYTVIDEATRERFIYPYREQIADNSVDCIRRAILYFGYKPEMIQTDNGSEFVYTQKLSIRLISSARKKELFIRQQNPEHRGTTERLNALTVQTTNAFTGICVSIRMRI